MLRGAFGTASAEVSVYIEFISVGLWFHRGTHAQKNLAQPLYSSSQWVGWITSYIVRMLSGASQPL